MIASRIVRIEQTELAALIIWRPSYDAGSATAHSADA
jgi:hypothetical protein